MKSKTDKLLDELLKLHPKYIDLSLNRLKKLLCKLGNPHLNLPKTIHIAGTNGKGSVQSFIRTILTLNGYSCDAYISPHLTKFNERIIVRNKEISTSKLYKTLEFVRNVNNNNAITFFEITTAAAFILFQKSNSDFLILETGLGGRLDATNIISKKLCSIIMPISYDHEEYLGNTLKKITNEKLGIVKNNDFVLISKQKKVVTNYIKKKLSKKNNIYFYGKDFKVNDIKNKNFEFNFNKKIKLINKPRMFGLHQIENASVALAFSEIMKKNNLQLNFKSINKAIKETFWPGRIEIIKYNYKKIILDGSHNIDGAIKLNDFLQTNKIKPITIFGMLNNKKIEMFLKTIKNQISLLLAIKIPNEKNAYTSQDITDICKLLSINSKKVSDIKTVIKFIQRSNDEVFLITGSLYLIGKLRKQFL